MNNKILDLEQAYENWFCYDDYGSFGASRAMYITESKPEPFVRAAYMEGARRMAQEMLDTLDAYACAVAGIEGAVVTPSEVFERARENLASYCKDVLGPVENL